MQSEAIKETKSTNLLSNASFSMEFTTVIDIAYNYYINVNSSS